MIKPEKLKDVLGAMRSLGSNLQAFEDIAGDLKWLANSLEAFAKDASDAATTNAGKSETAAKKPEPAITLEQVRAVLAEKSRAGHTAAIRELLLKHGAAKLSGIDPKEYPALLAEAEALGNG